MQDQLGTLADVSEKDNEIEVIMQVPGVNKDDIKVSLNAQAQDDKLPLSDRGRQRHADRVRRKAREERAERQEASARDQLRFVVIEMSCLTGLQASFTVRSRCPTAWTRAKSRRSC